MNHARHARYCMYGSKITKSKGFPGGYNKKQMGVDPQCISA